MPVADVRCVDLHRCPPGLEVEETGAPSERVVDLQILPCGGPLGLVVPDSEVRHVLELAAVHVDIGVAHVDGLPDSSELAISDSDSSVNAVVLDADGPEGPGLHPPPSERRGHAIGCEGRVAERTTGSEQSEHVVVRPDSARPQENV